MFVSKLVTRKKALVGCNALALLVGVATATMFASHAHAGVAQAANHCTHYTPPYMQDTQWSCVDGSNFGFGEYTTQATALRDSNVAAMSTSQLVCVTYTRETYWSCNNVSSSQSQEGPRSGYHYAQCLIGDGGYGFCKTDWHD
jgi:hypothetical protein